MRTTGTDRVGLTWHPSLATSILAHAHRLDIVEVIPEGIFLETRGGRRALRTLAREVPVAIHGVSLGLSSAEGLDSRRLDAYARLIDEVAPEHWSEHLAFVRSGGIELGHLAAPPRTALSIEATAANVDRAARHVGVCPGVENVATLIDPPGSDRNEEAWLLDLLGASPAGLLLDLHNLVTNGRNFGYDPVGLVEALPADRILGIHIAGGMDVEASNGERRILDDHQHDVPDSVYALLERVASRVRHPIDVVLERDGAFPPFTEILEQLDRARAAIAAGRARRRAGSLDVATPAPQPERAGSPDPRLRAGYARFEQVLTRLYTDRGARERFLRNPEGEAAAFELDSKDRAALVGIDRSGLELAAASFARKRRSAGGSAT
jgi:uncharacterized protein (UPF0276 family)